MPITAITANIIDLAAKGVPPKEIADRLGLNDVQTVYSVRNRCAGMIDARRAELAERENAPKLSADEALDRIMGVIAPEPVPAPEPAPEPETIAIEPSDIMKEAIAAAASEPSAVNTHMLPREPAPEAPNLATVQVRLAGARHRYTITGKRIGIDGNLMLDADELSGFIRELESIQTLIIAQERRVST